ncbi:hypothetical protein DFR44_10715 [Hydromonas duriensis]|uniref:Uncharacterized protein n=1 Tax=Hydromonas duriensis TaxID=1527608 RepID=A0A4R6Y8P0_9BURK|nr:hypothetical protein DFR44_10715 [Hydromonas duriensis]
MIRCKTFIQWVVTEQINQLSISKRVQATIHPLMCYKCRTFKRNNKALNQILSEYDANKPDAG